jgi:transcriptional regulator with GAF, ATPase, and Fis domain/CHASE2 domain-containing sensor protein
MKLIHKFFSKDLVFILILAFLGSILASLPISFNTTLQNITDDFLFNLRGSRQFSEKIMFVYISQEDIELLGSWPLSRDYYAYIIHLVTEKKVAVTGIDILFENPLRLYPEFDENLSKYSRSAGNVCLPMVFSQIVYSNDQVTGKNPVFPMKMLQPNLAAIGFSNIGSTALVREVPISISYKDTTYHSFGYELAKIYYQEVVKQSPVNVQKSFIRLNHFGDLENLESYSLTEFFQHFTRDTFSLDLSGKVVLLGVTAPGKSTTVATPLSKALPASLIHATVTENILEGNYLREIPPIINWLVIFVLVLSLWFIGRIKNYQLVLTVNLTVIITFILIALLFFSYFYVTLPLIIPLTVYLLSNGFIYVTQRRGQSAAFIQQQSLLENQIALKEKQLREAQNKLQEFQDQLSDTEKQSEEILQLAENRKKSILQLESEIRDLQSYMKSPAVFATPKEFENIIHATDSPLTEVLNLVQRISTDDITVLIMGETGSGKEMIARAIHSTSQRSTKAFIAVNCGALTETLLESELFGHEKGSFTGATSRRRGRFELASGGTIFLDEITETSPAFQAKLLRVLQEGIFERVGGEQSLKVDVRVITASNKDVQELMEKDEFRSDLFYRLNGFQIKVPPLRERKQDIPLLAQYFLKKYEYQAVESFSDQVMDHFTRYNWPGNVRELENVIHRAALLANSDNRKIIRFSDLPEDFQKSGLSAETEHSYKSIEDQILETLRSFQFSHSAITQTAKALGNRDRGTITEYLRGICFQKLVKKNFDIDATARSVAASTDPGIVEQVKKKMNDYLTNLLPLPELPEDTSEFAQLSQFKGLPKKYHPDLIKVIQYLKKNPLN